MTPFAVFFLAINSMAILVLPKHWALLPFLVGSCYMTVSQSLDIGPFTFTVIRVLILVAFLRIAIQGERLSGHLNIVDRLVFAWGIWGIIVSFIHPMPSAFTLVNRLGSIYNVWGIYFLIRIFCVNESDAIRIIRLIALLLAPLAVVMLVEKMTGINSFASLGGVPYYSIIRVGKIRAQGPFMHPILAGTVGAVCFPLMLGIWRKSKPYSAIGATACVLMVFASASSGPLASMLVAIFALLLWKYRYLMNKLRWAAIVFYFGLEMVMDRPAYYIISFADLTGSSTGWHRARLIESAFAKIGEWWFAGTNYTRHWMPSGVSWSPDHTDITNYYLSWGVRGGLMWMILFIAILIAAFYLVGKAIKLYPPGMETEKFLVWSAGASLFAHAATSISVSYFDQSFLFIVLTIAVISSLYSSTTRAHSPNKSEGNSD